jgi:hypothetical protein
MGNLRMLSKSIQTKIEIRNSNDKSRSGEKSPFSKTATEDTSVQLEFPIRDQDFCILKTAIGELCGDEKLEQK